jgi:Fe-S cluster biogenesis protein NfuA
LPCHNIINRKEVQQVKERVEEVLKKVRPYLQRDGGDVELVDVDASGLVKVRLKGACSG